MIRSMTGFSNIERQFEFGRLSWEIRTVNHRYLEISLRLPEEFRVLEPAIRTCVGQYVSRGKVDASLRFRDIPGSGSSDVLLNRKLAERLLAVHTELAELAGHQESPSVTALMRWPGVVEERLPEAAPMHEAAMDLLQEAALELQAGRAREGEQISKAVLERVDQVAHWTAEVRSWLPDIREGLRKRLLDRIANLPQPMEPGRLEQEVALQSQKMDVDEELDRLDAHVAEVHRTVTLEEPVGRRLDFLMQEFNRESNTLSSKSVDQRTTQAAVELKVLIEQMREQVQNVE